MHACVDVAYVGDGARAAALVFADWTDARPGAEHVVDVPTVAPYEPGAFYRRELPCILRVLREVTAPLDGIVVDGYVWLAAERPGLGAHLYEALERRSAVIGVAKSAFAGNTVAVAVLRGGSKRPLFVTAAGIDAVEAAAHIRAMHGAHRIPTLLGRVDRLARGDSLKDP